MKIFLLSIFICLSSVSVFAQELTFQMSAFGINFGKMVVTRTQENDSTEAYSLHAKGFLKVILWERKDETKNTVRYENGKLLSSEYRQLESNVLKKWNKIHFYGRQYLVESQNGKRFFTERPTFSVLKLYFNNPREMTRIFSEAEAVYVPMKHLNDNTIEVKNSDGTSGVYHYENGTIHHLEFNTAIAKVSAKKLDY